MVRRVSPGVFSFAGDVQTAARLTVLEACQPGPRFLAELETLTAADLTPQGRVRVLAQWDRAEAWLAARKHSAIVAVAGPAPLTVDDWAREEIAAALRQSPATAGKRIRVARALTGPLAAAHAALAAGRLGVWHAVTLAEKTAHLDATAAAHVQRRVLPRAADQTVGEFRAAVDRAVIAADSRTADEQHTDAAAGRNVNILPGPHGTATIIAEVPAPDAAIVHRACDTLARELRTPGDPRTLPQRMADALTEICRRYLAGTLNSASSKSNSSSSSSSSSSSVIGTGTGTYAQPGTPRTAHGRPFTIDVTIDLATLVGLAEHPAHLQGYGPITPDVARDLARTTLWRWVLTDPATGVALDCTSAHDPGQHLTDIILRRHPTCTAVGCTLPSIKCDLDHNVRYPDGPTCECNIAPLCRRHHRMKHLAGWTLQHLPDHTMRWTTPTGLTYTVPPPAIGPPPPDPDYQAPQLQRPCLHPPCATPPVKELEPPF